jgi:hypothetical protein
MVDHSKATEEDLAYMESFATSVMIGDLYEQHYSQVEGIDMNKYVSREIGEDAEALKDEVTKIYGEQATRDGNTITYTDENGDPQTATLTDEEFKTKYAAAKA